MPFENPYLLDFAPIFFAVIREKGMNPAKMELIIFDERADEHRLFERADVLDVLYQLNGEINALTIYTDRPEYFIGFVESAYEENGLVTILAPKSEQKHVLRREETDRTAIILDFERRGACYEHRKNAHGGYIPIYKKPWEIRENLDILVPFGYNTVIVKSNYENDKKFVNDRFEEGFYRDE